MFISGWLKNRNSSGDPEEFRLSLVEHLDELRVRIIKSVVMLMISGTAAWFLVPQFYTRLEGHIKSLMPPNFQYTEIFLGITDAFMLRIKLSFTLGLLISLPLIVIQVWGFVEPGLKPNERKPFKIIGPLSVLLFALGCYFCWLVLPTTIQWFVAITQDSFSGIKVTQEAGRMVFFVLNLMLAFGICFQLPLIVFFLAAVGIISSDTLRDYWRQAVVIIFLVAAIATPSNDPITMMMMAIPLCILFLLSVVAVRFFAKNKETDALDDGKVVTDETPETAKKSEFVD